MKNMSIMSVEGVSPMNLVNSSNKTGSAEEFQKCMDHAQDNTSTETTTKAVTKTSVVNEGKEVEQAGNENSVYETSENVEMQEEMVAEEFVDAVEQKIKELIKSVLDVEESELENIMDELGLTYLQLLDPANLQKLVMEVNGAVELTDFLTNENMLAQFTELTQSFEEIDWKALTGMEKQDFLNFLEESVNQNDLAETANSSVEVSVNDMENPLGKNPEDVLQNVSDVEVQNLDDGVEYSPTDSKSEVQGNAVSDIKVVAKDTMENLSGQELFQSEGGMQNGILHQSVENVDNSQSVTVMNFVENLTQAVATENVSATSHIQQMIDIVHQVVERIQTTIQSETTTMEMQLNPESLGKVLLTVSDKNGVMTANFTVQTDEAREALESQLQVLRENLEQKNLKVESVEVSVSDFDFTQNNQMGSGDQKDLQHGDGKRRNFRFDEEEQEEELAQVEAERVRRSVMRDSGSSVDYTA